MWNQECSKLVRSPIKDNPRQPQGAETNSTNKILNLAERNFSSRCFKTRKNESFLKITNFDLIGKDEIDVSQEVV